MLAEEPKFTFERFIMWVEVQHVSNPNSDGNAGGIMLAAHYGSCHDHIHLLKGMMKWGITPPNYMLVDTLAIFKIVRSMNEKASLKTLVNRYAPWFPHEPHDANSDADALRFVTMITFPNTRMACYAFAIPCQDYMNRTGLNMYMPSPIVTFKNRMMYASASANTQSRVTAPVRRRTEVPARSKQDELPRRCE
ncbi:MAG: hypothetical protein Q9210_000863 [Variospora velana]